jgi:hypothetical protein
MYWLSNPMFRHCQHTLSHVPVWTSIGMKVLGINGKSASRALLTCLNYCELSVQANSVRYHSSSWMRIFRRSALASAAHGALPAHPVLLT